MDEVIRNDQPIVTVGGPLVERLREMARRSPKRHARLCLHHDHQDTVQEMVIVMHRDSYLQPHRHPAGYSESYHVIDGAMRVAFFAPDGRLTRTIRLSSRGDGPFLYRLGDETFHFVMPLDEWVVYHEALSGPYQRDRMVEDAAFAPSATDSHGVAALRARIEAFAQTGCDPDGPLPKDRA